MPVRSTRAIHDINDDNQNVNDQNTNDVNDPKDDNPNHEINDINDLHEGNDIVDHDSVFSQAIGGSHVVFLGGSGDTYHGAGTDSSLVIASSHDVIETEGGKSSGLYLT